MKLGEDTRDPANRWIALADLAIVVVVAVLTALLAYARLDGLMTPFRTLLGLLSVLLFPGYVTLAAVLRRSRDDPEPERSEWVGHTGSGDWSRPLGTVDGPSRLEWLVLSFLISLVVVPLLGILMSLADVAIRPNTVVSVVTAYTLLVAVVAAVRRLVSEDDGRSPLEAVGAVVRRARNPPTRTDAFLNLTLVLVLVVAGVSVVAPGVGHDDSRFTEFYVLSGGGSGGPADPVMSDYLSTNDTDGTKRLLAGITNREGQEESYTVVVQVQRAEVRNASVQVLDRRRTSTFSAVLPHNGTARIPYEVDTEGPATGCRVAFLLYRGDVPASPTVENAYRELHLWDTPTPPPEGPACSSLDAIDTRVTGEGVGP